MIIEAYNWNAAENWSDW